MYAKVKGAIVSSTDSKKAATSLDDAKKSGDKYTIGNVEVKNGDIYYLASDDKKEAIEQPAIEITDTVTWTSNKPAIVSVAGDDAEAVLTAKAVGTAVVTAKASSGKTAKVTVAVKATLSGLDITNTERELYSGQSLQMTFDRTPVENKDGVKWSIKKVKYLLKNGVEKEKAHPNATINAKGLLKIKPKLDLSETGTDDSYQVVTVVLESKTTKKLEDGKKVPVASDEYDIVISQSSIDKITVTDDADVTVAEVFTEYKDNGSASVKQSLKPSDKANTTYISVPKDRTYTAVVEASKGLDYEAGTDTLTWTTSNAKVASISYTADGKAKITANANGKATITVSGIRAVDKDGSIKSASVIKTTFKVDVKQPVNTVTLNKPSVVLNQKIQKKAGEEVIADQKVALKATLGPKGVKKEAVYWSVKENGTELTDLKALGLKDNKDKLKTAANVSINLPAPAIGDVFEITAKTESGAYAVSTVKIVNKTTSVAIAKKSLGADRTPVLFSEKNKQGTKDVLNTKNADLGETFKMYPCINIGKDAKNNVDYYTAGTENCEDVTYSVNKKGIVTIDNDGTVHAINKGTVKITAKTPLGKKATLTVNVSLPQG